jgi:hypothetical protein
MTSLSVFAQWLHHAADHRPQPDGLRGIRGDDGIPARRQRCCRPIDPGWTHRRGIPAQAIWPGAHRQDLEIEGSVAVGAKIDMQRFSDAIETKLWERVGKANWKSFEQARAFARSLRLKSEAEWRKYTKSGQLPPDIPTDPMNVYKNEGWAGLGDWLGTGTIAPRLRQYRSFEDGRAFARSLGLKSRADWNAFVHSGQLPPDIPATPEHTYKECGWAGCANIAPLRTQGHLPEVSA